MFPPALAPPPLPTQVKAQELPEGVEAQAAGHDRVVDKVAGEKPQIGRQVEFGIDVAFAVVAPLLVDAGDAVDHEHGGQGQLGVAGAKEFTAGTGEEFFATEGVLAGHKRIPGGLGAWVGCGVTKSHRSFALFHRGGQFLRHSSIEGERVQVQQTS